MVSKVRQGESAVSKLDAPSIGPSTLQSPGPLFSACARSLGASVPGPCRTPSCPLLWAQLRLARQAISAWVLPSGSRKSRNQRLIRFDCGARPACIVLGVNDGDLAERGWASRSNKRTPIHARDLPVALHRLRVRSTLNVHVLGRKSGQEHWPPADAPCQMMCCLCMTLNGTSDHKLHVSGRPGSVRVTGSPVIRLFRTLHVTAAGPDRAHHL